MPHLLSDSHGVQDSVQFNINTRKGHIKQNRFQVKSQAVHYKVACISRWLVFLLCLIQLSKLSAILTANIHLIQKLTASFGQ